MEKVTIGVDGMSCGHCKAAVEGALSSLEGVTSAMVSLSEKNVVVEYDPSKVTLEGLKEEIENNGYDVM
ncbi:copper chaperone CopZ [Anaerobacillus sp. MEB173]|uniref:copper chaperone CopZ n=1 Tax=Anaerobacillus sp. MEB173 TaxID=3383345 RepID=UPI003F907391